MKSDSVAVVASAVVRRCISFSGRRNNSTIMMTNKSNTSTTQMVMNNNRPPILRVVEVDNDYSTEKSIIDCWPAGGQQGRGGKVSTCVNFRLPSDCRRFLSTTTTTGRDDNDNDDENRYYDDNDNIKSYDNDNNNNNNNNNNKNYHEEDFDNYDDDDEYDDGYDNNDYYLNNKDNNGHRNRSNNSDNNSSSIRRIWLDPNVSVQDRVNRFMRCDLGELHPLDVTLASVDLIRECCKLHTLEGMKYGQDILDRILEEKRHVNSKILLQLENDNNSNYNTTKKYPIFISERPFKVLMYGWSNLSRKVEIGPDRMREILDLMIEEAKADEKFKYQQTSSSSSSDDDTVVVAPDDNINNIIDERRKISERDNAYAGLSCQPTVDIYNTLLQGLEQAAYRTFNAAFEAEKLLGKMERYHDNLGWHTKPNTRSYSLVLAAFARTNHESAGDRAEAVLRKMIDFHEQDKLAYKEETGNDYYDDSNNNSNQRRIVTPDTIAYTTVIQAHAKSNADGSAEKALALLVELINSDSPSLRPDAFAFANTINAFAKKAGHTTKMKTRKEAAESAEEILWLMVEECKKPNSNLEVTVVPFNACINAWIQGNVPKSPIRAEAILHQMLDPELQQITNIYPNTATFNGCMNAWAKASKTNPEGPYKAEEVLNLMLELSLSDDGDDDTAAATTIGGIPHPDLYSFTTVMNAYSRSPTCNDKASQVCRILLQLLKTTSASKKQKGGKTKMKMTAVPFTVVLNAVANSRSINETLDDGGFGGGSDGEDDPYSIALETYNDVWNDSYELGIEPDHIFFATMLDVIRKHTDVDSIERRQRIETIFADACQSGNVSFVVLEALIQACPSPSFLQEMLQLKKNIPPSKIRNVNLFPSAWTQNVPPQFRKRKGSRWSRRERKTKDSTSAATIKTKK